MALDLFTCSEACLRSRHAAARRLPECNGRSTMQACRKLSVRGIHRFAFKPTLHMSLVGGSGFGELDAHVADLRMRRGRLDTCDSAMPWRRDTPSPETQELFSKSWSDLPTCFALRNVLIRAGACHEHQQ